MKLPALLKIALINLWLLSGTVLAHPGHGDETGLPHAMEHAAWFVGSVLLAVVLWRGVLSKPAKERNKKR